MMNDLKLLNVRVTVSQNLNLKNVKIKNDSMAGKNV